MNNNSIVKKIPLFPFLAFGIAFLLFAGFIDNFFYYDDFRYLENNFHGTKEILLGYNTLRIISNSIWAPLYQLFGFNPTAYNLLNIVLYAVNAIVFFYFVRIAFKNRTLAFFSGLFFILSGVGVDAVLWKCANNSLFCLCFYLLTLIFFVLFREGGSRKHLFLSVMFFTCAMFSKEEAASLPAIIVMMEYFLFSGKMINKTTLLRILPYCIIICIYLLLNKIVFSWLALAPAELARFYQINPLYSLVGGFSVFFLPPTGIVRSINPLAYFAGPAVLASLFLVKDKKLLLFAFGWVFITFLPQSLTSLGQLDPKYMSNSISRYLYIVSIGPALLYAALLVNLQEKLNRRSFFVVAVLAVSVYGWINYENVQKRGLQWKLDAAPVALFLTEVGKITREFPPNSFIYVDNPPTGRAYIQQSMRAFFRNPTITWIKNPESFRPKPGERAFLINVFWSGPTKIQWMQISEPWPARFGQ